MIQGHKLTLFCDASFHKRSRAAGWGAWAKRDGWKAGLVLGGEFRTLDMKESHEAELGAIANAFARLSSLDHMAGVTTVWLQSDCLRALHAIRTRLPKTAISDHEDGASIPVTPLPRVTKFEASVLDWLQEYVTSYQLQLIARHVRGHRAGGNRQWVNRTCDEVAYKHMIEARKKRPDQLWKRGTHERA